MGKMITKLFLAVSEYGYALGVRNINTLPGCWEHQIDNRWWVAVNAHKETLKCSKGVMIPQFSMYVEFNGWPAGIFDVAGGEFAAGSEANENEFLKALKSQVLQ